MTFFESFTQLTPRLYNFLRLWLLVLGLKEGLVECATVCVKSEVILEHYCEAKMNFTVNYEKAILSHSHLPPVLLHSLLQKDIYPLYVILFHLQILYLHKYNKAWFALAIIQTINYCNCAPKNHSGLRTALLSAKIP